MRRFSSWLRGVCILAAFHVRPPIVDGYVFAAVANADSLPRDAAAVAALAAANALSTASGTVEGVKFNNAEEEYYLPLRMADDVDDGEDAIAIDKTFDVAGNKKNNNKPMEQMNLLDHQQQSANSRKQKQLPPMEISDDDPSTAQNPASVSGVSSNKVRFAGVPMPTRMPEIGATHYPPQPPSRRHQQPSIFSKEDGPIPVLRGNSNHQEGWFHRADDETNNGGAAPDDEIASRTLREYRRRYKHQHLYGAETTPPPKRGPLSPDNNNLHVRAILNKVRYRKRLPTVLIHPPPSDDEENSSANTREQDSIERLENLQKRHSASEEDSSQPK